MSTIDTTFNDPAPQPFPAPPPVRRSRTGGSVATIVVGAVIAVGGLLTAVSGAVLLAIFGGGNAISSGDHLVSTETSALVADLGHVDNIRGFEPLTGSPTLQLSAKNLGDSGVFVGVGRSADVDRYLSGVAIDRVADLDFAPFRLNTVRDAGWAMAGAPAEQTFWVASALSGTDPIAEAQLSWKIDEGDYEIVVMNADGSAAVLSTVAIRASLPTSTGLWTVVIVIGGLVLVGGTALVVVGARAGAKR